MAITIPKITWDTAFANTWLFPGPLDNPRSVSPTMISVIESKSGLRDAWVDRDDEELLFEVPLIPRVAVGSVTGWSDANGARDALRWLAKQNAGRFYPDNTSGSFHTFQLIDPDLVNHVRRSQGGARYTVQMRIRDTTATAFSEY